jgi:hypothetical protein
MTFPSILDSIMSPHVFTHAFQPFSIWFAGTFLVSLWFWWRLKMSKKVLMWLMPMFVVFYLGTMTFLDSAIQNVVKNTSEKLLGYAPSYAAVMTVLGHENLNAKTDDQDQRFLTIIELEKTWARENPFITDI